MPSVPKVVEAIWSNRLGSLAVLLVIHPKQLAVVSGTDSKLYKSTDRYCKKSVIPPTVYTVNESNRRLRKMYIITRNRRKNQLLFSTKNEIRAELGVNNILRRLFHRTMWRALGSLLLSWTKNVFNFAFRKRKTMSV